MNIKTDLTQLIGGTPMLELCKIEEAAECGVKLIAKLESFNPMGSLKERAAYEMITDGERKGFVNEGTVVIEPTSGNAGVAIAFICAVRGYRVILTMPESIPAERRAILTALGAEIRLTPASDGMKGAIAEANRLCEEIKNSFMPMQFQNPANPRAHRQTTAQEIWRDTDGIVDIFVAGFGSGGTISGVGAGLKALNPRVQIVGIEPAASAVASGGKPGPHKIQGLGPGFIPINLDLDVIDEIIPVSNEDAFAYMDMLAKKEGLLVGVSSGAVLAGALEVAKRRENKGKNVVMIFADNGERYLYQGIYT
ncbi:MAG: cysteine synthase A [Oscillospiraceae bacterium]|nr:cysteine synthase A [Oscillospiraceae bacterium]